ncbi:hypothetical protein JB92DRAFT_2951448 [Gautieria morchelliformis]|nr:hypothetical protein JB92DRAFT_2951448 [Gautieria morchelliformis]
MMTSDDDPRRIETRLLHDSSSPSENWDDDFEFQAGVVASAGDNANDAMDAPTRPAQSFEQEEIWDDAYEDDNTHTSPVKRTRKVDDDDVEDWDSSDNELETPNEVASGIRHRQMREPGPSEIDEDKTVTGRPTSRPPEPALPLPIPPLHPALHFQAHTVLPPSTSSPTLSSFSIPLSSTTRDRASVYSQDPLMPSSNSSAPHLSVMRSYPHAVGSTPPRKGRRLRKKSRPPEADIFELEDREPDPVPVPLSVPVNVPELDLPRPTTPPRAPQQLTSESPSRPPLPSAPPTPSSGLLTRIGSFKRWARRSMGPDDPALSGWRRAKNSTAPSEGKSSHGPSEVPTREEESSVGPEGRTSVGDSADLDLRAASPTPAPGNLARRSRGESASGLKSGWFFRAGGAAESVQEDTTTPVVHTPQLTPSKRGTTLGLRRRREPIEDDDDQDAEGKTPTPRKGKGKLVPTLRVAGSPGSHKLEEPVSPTRSSRRSLSRDRPESRPNKGTRPMSMLLPRNGGLSMGRNAGLSVSGSISPGVALSPSAGDSPEKDAKARGESKDREGGMRGLMNGVRRLSLVNAGHTHKRTKSTGAGDGTEDAARKEVVMRPHSQTGYHPGSGEEKPTSHTSNVRLESHQPSDGKGLLPPMELDSPMSGIYARRGSLPWADYDDSPVAEAHTGVSFTASVYRSLQNVPVQQSQHPQSFSTSKSSLLVRPPGESSSSESPIKRSPATPAPVQRPVDTPTPEAVPRSCNFASPAPAEQRPVLELRPTTAPSQPHSPSLPPAPSTPPSQSASLGRSTGSPSHPAGLRRNSLGDLKTPLNTLGEHKPQLPPLGELKIPARISRAQQGLRRDMGMVREFAGCVEQLKRLQATYTALLGALRAAYEASGAPASAAAQVQFHLPSRPTSRAGMARKAIMSPSNPSVQNLHQAVSLNSPTLPHPASSISRASHEVSRELVRLEHEYGIWWECAELLVELGGGSEVAVGTASNPNLATRSTSTLNVRAEDSLKLKSSEAQHAILRPIAHASSMSDPGSLFNKAISPTSNSKGPPQASPLHHSQWRASTGRHDLSARQLRLLKDMLNTPDPASLAYAAGPYGYGAGYPHPQVRPYVTTEVQPWRAWNPSAVTLPSEESSIDAHPQGAVAAAETREEGKEKKRRTSRLGMLGLREILRGLKRNAVAEGRLSTTGEIVHGQQGSESSMSNSPEDDHYNRRRSPWHQHDGHHATRQAGAALNVALDHPTTRTLPPKSPRRPSLAYIFRLGNKNVKEGSANGKHKDASPKGNGTVPSEGEREPDLAAAATAGEYSDWERMSRSDLDLDVVGSGPGSATVRGKRLTKAPASQSSGHINYPYSNPVAATPQKTPATSQTSLWDSPPSATSPPSRLPLSIAEEDGDRPSRIAKTPEFKRSVERTASWSEAHPPRPVSQNGRAAMSGTVRSAPPSDFSPDPKLALTPETIKPLLEYAKEVGTRLSECISEVQTLLGTSPKAS